MSPRPSTVRRPRRHGFLCLLGISTLLAFVSFAPGLVAAATLTIEGPAGTEVFVDGEAVGVLPLAPLTLDGEDVLPIECRLRGHITYKSWVSLPEADSDVVHQVELLPLDRRTAVVASAFLAGTGQLYQDRKLKGYSLIALQGAAWATVLLAELEFQSSRDDFEQFDQEYSEAVLASEITRLRDARAAAYDDMGSFETMRTIGFGAVIAVGLYAIYDAWKGHDNFFAGTEIAPASGAADESAAAAGIHLGWRGRF